MISFDTCVILKELKLNYTKATFSNIGDEFIWSVSEGGFSPHLYNRRHIISSGSFRIDWMVGGTVIGLYHIHTSESENNMIVFPYKHQPCDAIRLTALEPNSSYYCFVPLLQEKNKISEEIQDLEKNQNFTTQIGRLYVSNIDLKVKDSTVKAFTPFGSVYNSVNIIPNDNCRIINFLVD